MVHTFEGVTEHCSPQWEHLGTYVTGLGVVSSSNITGVLSVLNSDSLPHLWHLNFSIAMLFSYLPNGWV